ncbi:MAG TPA: extracellular solute-binding protein [Defluviitaleaceae bacterium]|nr:extracellular solute-binding protein [Defluviitaleaceae bacterium]
MVLATVTGCSKERISTGNESATEQTTTTEKENDENKDSEKKSLTGEITYWHFNPDEGPAIARAFEKANPGVKIKDEITADTNGNYQTKVQAASRSGSLPDVYAAESAFVKRFVNMPGGYMPLNDFEEIDEVTSQLVPFVLGIGTNEQGQLVALSHQATAGGVGYKRPIAKQYLGTDDPTQIEEMLKPEKMIETGRKLKEVSGGKAILWAGIEELVPIYLGAREHAWVEDGKFVIDEKVYELVDIAAQLRKEGLEGGLTRWEEAWANSIQDDTHMCYAVPTWGINWIIDCRESADVMVMTTDDHPEPGTGGRWAICTPMPYNEGGTWFGISQNTKNPELAWEFIKFIASPEYQESLAQAGDFVSNKNIIEKYKADDSFINKVINQNIYQVYSKVSDQINGNVITQYDDTIRMALLDCLNSYLAGEISEEEMWKQFKERLQSELQGENIVFE